MSIRHIQLNEQTQSNDKLPLLKAPNIQKKGLIQSMKGQFQLKPLKGSKEKMLKEVTDKNIDSLILSLTQLRRWILTQPGMIEGSVVLGATVDLLSDVKNERELISKRRMSTVKKEEQDKEYENWLDGNNFWANEVNTHLGGLKKEESSMKNDNGRTKSRTQQEEDAYYYNYNLVQL